MRDEDSFYALVGRMEKDSSERVFQTRKMRPPSPDGVIVDWQIVAAEEVQMMLFKSRVVGRHNLKNYIANICNAVPFESAHEDLSKKKEEVSNILADMKAFEST